MTNFRKGTASFLKGTCYLVRNPNIYFAHMLVSVIFVKISLSLISCIWCLCYNGTYSNMKTVWCLHVQVVVTSSNQQGSSVQEQVEEMASQDSSSDIVPKTPSSKNSIVGSSTPTTPTGSHATGTLNATAHILPGVSTASAILSASTSARGVLENASAILSSSPINIAIPSKEEDIASSPGRKSSPALSETGVRGVGRGGLNSPLSTSNPLSSGGTIPSNGALGVLVPSASEMAKRNILVADERLGSTGMVQPMVSPLSNRMMLPQAAKANDGINSSDSGNVGEAAVIAGRVFSPSVVPGIQWRPGSSFQNQNEAVCQPCSSNLII